MPLFNVKSVLRYVHLPAVEYAKAMNVLKNANLSLPDSSNVNFFEQIKHDQPRLSAFVACAPNCYKPIYAPKVGYNMARLPVFYATHIGLIANINPFGKPHYLLCFCESPDHIGRLTPFVSVSEFLMAHAHHITPSNHIHPLTFMTYYGCDPVLMGAIKPARPNAPFTYIWAVAKTPYDDAHAYHRQGIWHGLDIDTGDKPTQNLCQVNYIKALEQVKTLAEIYPDYDFQLMEYAHEF